MSEQADYPDGKRCGGISRENDSRCCDSVVERLSRIRRLAVAFVSGLLLLGAANAGKANEGVVGSKTGEPDILKRVLAHWREREARTKSLYFAWDRFWQPSSHRDEKEPVGRGELWMDGDRRYRVAYTPPEQDSTRRQSGPAARIARWQHQFDGATHRFLSQKKLGFGRIWKEDEHDEIDFGFSGLAPLMLAVRPMSHGGFDASLKGWHIVGQNAILAKWHCLKLQSADEGCIQTLWIDTNRDDVIVGWAESIRSDSEIAIIEYRQDSTARWIPAGWTVIRESQAGQPREECFVVAGTVNRPIAPQSLALEFPVGATVLDKTRNERYVVAKDGSKANVLACDTPESLELAQQLEQPVDFAVRRMPLKRAIRLITGRFNLDVQLDPESVKKGLIDPECEVELQATGVSLKDFVRRVLNQSQKPLTYVLREGKLIVVPTARR